MLIKRKIFFFPVKGIFLKKTPFFMSIPLSQLCYSKIQKEVILTHYIMDCIIFGQTQVLDFSPSSKLSSCLFICQPSNWASCHLYVMKNLLRLAKQDDGKHQHQRSSYSLPKVKGTIHERDHEQFRTFQQQIEVFLA